MPHRGRTKRSAANRVIPDNTAEPAAVSADPAVPEKRGSGVTGASPRTAVTNESAERKTDVQISQVGNGAVLRNNPRISNHVTFTIEEVNVFSESDDGFCYTNQI